MPAILSHHAYGKSNVRLVKVIHHADRHELLDVEVDVMLEGDFGATYLTGDNRTVLPTDTVKNTVYALAKQQEFTSSEAFGMLLTNHFLSHFDHVERATATLRERLWSRIEVDQTPHRHAFNGASREQHTVVVDQTRASVVVTGGLADLPILKTTGSAFRDFLRDEFTLLEDADDRLFGTNMTARWTYLNGSPDFDFTASHALIRRTLLETFAQHDASESVQQTLFLMGQNALDVCPDIADIYLKMPNEHRLLVDLTPFGLENPNEIFMPIDKPSGMIEAQLQRER